jgi:phospholipid-binding lipoprotein MlaA
MVYTTQIFTSMKQALRAVILLGVLLATGCATIDPEFADPRDPWESLNRSVFSFNEGVDKAVMKPLSQIYKAVTPDPIDQGITNFFNNIGDVASFVNNLLQFKIKSALNDIGRVVINTTVGIGGLFDVASNLNLPRQNEDFGQTLGVWGMGSGPYMVLPFLGPSSGRDTLGKVGDWFTNPTHCIEDSTLRYSLRGLDILDTRGDLLNTTRVIDEAALDPYVFMRDAYLQRRLDKVYDGNPPEPEFE